MYIIIKHSDSGGLIYAGDFRKYWKCSEPTQGVIACLTNRDLIKIVRNCGDRSKRQYKISKPHRNKFYNCAKACAESGIDYTWEYESPK